MYDARFHAAPPVSSGFNTQLVWHFKAETMHVTLSVLLTVQL